MIDIMQRIKTIPAVSPAKRKIRKPSILVMTCTTFVQSQGIKTDRDIHRVLKLFGYTPNQVTETYLRGIKETN